MKLFLSLALAALIAPAPVLAQDTPPSVTAAVAEAQDAAAQLRAAMAKLAEAVSADDQVTALTDVIRGYEQGLAALREGLRQASARERDLRADFESQRARLASVLGAMTALQQAPEATMLLHPAGALANARSGMVLESVTPGLRSEAERLADDLREIATVRELQGGAAQMLGSGLASVQEARRLLASAVTDRSSLPVRYADAPAEMQALRDAAQSLDDFAAGVAGLQLDVGPPMEDFEGAQGTLPLPVVGTILRLYGQADAAGVERPGWVIATPPSALVTTPWPATLRYRGPLLDYGNVMIVEPARGYLLVLAGMAQVFGEVGDVLQAGDPLGLMGGTEVSAQEFGAQFVADAAIGGNAGRTESLYLELRKGQETLDPAEWFVLNPVVQPEQE
ncbi:peptidase M23 [Paracoccus sediminis]|uniref:Peptidase M23 n=1 Tax=Paracoccus sediminis TaxID=1214787 RepID=A0A238W305_9RHOB|nr:peptidoglycan DD-metalloendopeptidase family protein [Paracoccus sediminis]TBN51531.1 peptidase M23 [Paracoccus sediminis]SNR40932.1 Septal ring factor EnvC, activator of murein hydrolases AmiA and AmiB [Paracoccus sediminis]